MSFQKLTELRDELKSNNKGNVAYFETGETTMIRLLPVKDKDIPFHSAFVHYKSNQVVPKTVFSPKSWGKTDALKTFMENELAKGQKPTDEFKFLINLKPTPLVIAPIIIRGKEEEGVKLWTLNESQYEKFVDKLKASFHPQQPPNIWDTEEGFDIIIDVKKGEKYRSYEYSIARQSTPLQQDDITDEQVSEWLNDQPSWEEAYKKATNEELKDYLQNHLSEAQEQEEMDDDLAEYSMEDDLDEDIDDVEDEEEDEIVQDALNEFKSQSRNSNGDESNGSGKEQREPVAEQDENPFDE